MPARTASIELLASPHDVWAYVSEPYNFADWWPPVATVEPDRRGFATGARWQVRLREATLFRKPDGEDVLVVHAAQPEERFGFEIVRAKVRAELVLAPTRDERTHATLAVKEPFRISFTRGQLAKDALARLHDLVQTGAGT
ncbi:MAG: SRPBCC family protein [Gaiellaceae bacterium]